jgi:hypothetical protein
MREEKSKIFPILKGGGPEDKRPLLVRVLGEPERSIYQ